MHETETFQKVKQNRNLKASNEENGKADNGHWDEVQNAFRLYKLHLLGTASCWFLLDVDFYANGLFSHEVTAKILSHDSRPTTAYEDTINSFILCLISVPGYYLSVRFLEIVGRKAVQFNGFVAMSICFFICGFAHDWFLSGGENDPRRWLFLLVYALTFTFSNFGPNTTTFVIPGEIYPPEVRATCHGLSAASGKLGAAAGAYFFPLVLGTSGGGTTPSPNGLKNCFYICGGVALLGALVTTLFTPTYGAVELEKEESYIALDYAQFYPSVEDIHNSHRGKEGYQMIEVIESACDYSLEVDNEDDEDESRLRTKDGKTPSELWKISTNPAPSRAKEIQQVYNALLPREGEHQP